ncbi:MAG: hypothetical protein GXO81_07645 [Chlorobi bacterium]|nr:hypothetical protein [Chlorobiota bacterium]
MKRIAFLSIVFSSIIFSLMLNSCNGQTGNKAKGHSKKDQPKADIIVKKEYDKDGNLIKYDSTYYYYYSNIENDTIARDSIFNQFRSYFNQKYFFSEDPFFNDLFFQDSLLYYDFYKKDFFTNRFMDNMERMKKLFLGMDSIKNNFFIEQYKPEKKE